MRSERMGGKDTLNEEQRTDSGSSRGRALLGIRLLPSLESRATDGIPCCHR